MSVPPLRLREANGAPLRPERELVLYWMIAARRTRWNFALERAVALAQELDRPLVVLEALRCGHRWASARFHRFVLDGMRDNARALAGKGVLYHPYVEPRPGEGKGLLEALAARACAVVTDEFPCFFLPEMVQAAAGRLDVRLEVVDSNVLLPLRAADRVFTTAHSFRVHLQKELLPHLSQAPRLNPLARVRLRPLDRLAREVTKRWPAASSSLLEGSADELVALPIDHEVTPTNERGGQEAGDRALKRFLDERLSRYGEDRNDLVDGAASGLSAYLHWGHVSTHQVLDRLGTHVGWTVDDVSRRSIGGKREGWWGTDPSSEAFLDELVTWREVGFQFCHKRADYDRYASLPGWALDTLSEHAGDRREPCYERDRLEAAETHDELWNAAQRQLRGEGRIHNYLRMLWGKKVLEWTASPEEALEVLVELNNRWALDGRDPNSYSGIFWTLGRFDRAWGPERPIFGKVRYMSSDSTRRKLDVKPYLERWGEPGLFA
jgi:deoxyribodipyrimidine photo-lyase